ncbi:MAG: restriction endonuclease subunit S [Gammaproteobacteria bacterium]
MRRDMPSGWKASPLIDVATLQRGFDLPEHHRRNGLIPVYGSNGVDGTHNQAAVLGPGIITGRSGTIGKVHFEPRDYWPLNTTLYVRDLHGNDPKFIARLLEGLELKRFSASTGVPSPNRNFVHPTPVLVPPPEEQNRIAAVLDAVDEAIARTDAVIAKLRQVRADLLHDLLTRGLDEHGQLRPPPSEAPHLYKDFPLGRIPKKWEVAQFGSLAQFITSGSRGWARYYSEEGALFLRIGNLTREHIDLRLEDIVRVRPPAGSERARTKVEPGDILISITADLGIIGVIPEPFEEAYVNQHIALVRPIRTVCPRWIGRYLSFGSAARFFRMLNDTGAKAGMSLPSIALLVVAIPNREEQGRAKVLLDWMDADIALQHLHQVKLQNLKSGLMADLLTGRVRVPEGVVTR